MTPFTLRDLTHLSPLGYRKRPRRLAEIRAAVGHQMGVGTWRETNAMLAKVRAHFVVLPSGAVLHLHPITQRMWYGCGPFNEHAINIEFLGNFPVAYRRGEPVYWEPDTFGRSVLGAPQIEAGRSLLAWLKEQVPNLQVGAHRQLDDGKGGCPGPDIFREVVAFAVDSLDMPLMPTRGGLDIPPEWYAHPSAPVVPGLRPYDGPLNVTG